MVTGETEARVDLGVTGFEVAARMSLDRKTRRESGMKVLVWTGLVAMLCGVAGAQAPAGAPAGANGICRDGTYSTAASKSGACQGHKGVQTWYAAAPAKAAGTAGGATPAVAPAPAAAATPPSAPAKAAGTAGAAVPAAAPAPSGKTSAAKGGPAAAAAGKTAAPGGGPGLVWVNTESKVYHCYGTTFYGKTKAGQYMSEADAKAKGAHGDRGQVCSK